MPDGYASNLGKRVDIKRGILHGMKSHDCHVFMEQLLPIAFCGLPENIWKPMTEIIQSLSIFNQPGKGSKKRTLRKLTENEKKSAELHVLLNCPEVQPFLDYFVSQYGYDQVFPSFITWYTNWVYNSENAATFDQFFKDISWGPITVHTLSQYNINGFKFSTEKYSKNKKTNNNGVWVKGDDGNQNENVDYFGVLQEIVELEYSGLANQKNSTFPMQVNAKQVYYAPYPLRRDKSDWWVVIKTKPMGRVEVENELDVAYQNEISSVHQVVDAELEMNLEHPDHILEEVNREVLVMPTNKEEDEEETFEEDEWIDEEETSEDDACEWIDDEETSEEDE
ncbi:hypothetical protein MTR67_017564 [Solanum verrucosum]|uniref:DUF4216 domain-containing protein n=1 Tax=Solanum verrucosum TaxID=315347 RepID=A0AAF0QI61_SOLVR|nr:hypothetical protein MTR67_017564 [Solanum verrucosum]